MARYLVTGGAGFIGSHLFSRLLSDGHSVVVLDDFSTGTALNIRAAIDSLDPDPERFCSSLTLPHCVLEDEELRFAATCEDGVQGIFHLAAVASLDACNERPQHSWSVNVNGTRNVLRVAEQLGVPVVFASSIAASSPGDSRYAASKAAAERLVLSCEHATALRFQNVYGPRQSPTSSYAAVIPTFLGRLLSGDELVIYGDGLQSRDFVYVEDVVEAMLAALDRGYGSPDPYDIGTGVSTSIMGLVTDCEQAAGVDASSVQLTSAKEGELRHACADTGPALRDLGWQSRVALDEGLQRTAEWMRTP